MALEIIFLNLDCKGEITGKRYVGEFEMKLFLQLKDRQAASRIKKKLTNDIAPEDDVFFVLSLLTDLNAHIIKKPVFWGEEGLELEDVEPIMALARELRKAQDDSTKPPEAEVVKEEKPEKAAKHK